MLAIVAPVVGALMPLAVEVDFAPIAPPEAYPPTFWYRYVVGSEAESEFNQVRVSGFCGTPAEARTRLVPQLQADGAAAVADGTAVVITRFRGRPVTRFAWQSVWLRPAVRWVARPDRLTGEPRR